MPCTENIPALDCGEATFVLGVDVPRVSAAHEQEVRDRILAAATRVCAEKGYHSSTIADVVRESGLSVGAIYSYFSGKDELIRLTCDQIAAPGLREPAARLPPGTTPGRP